MSVLDYYLDLAMMSVRVVFFGVAVLFLGAMLTSCTRKEGEKSRRLIVKVGGCNSAGLCGVMYDNYRTGREYYPVVGECVYEY